MKKLFIVACLLANVSANAQPVPQNVAPLPSEFTLKVTAEEINLISEGISSLPFNKVVTLVNKLRSQIMIQQQPPKPVDNPEPNKN